MRYKLIRKHTFVRKSRAQFYGCLWAAKKINQSCTSSRWTFKPCSDMLKILYKNLRFLFHCVDLSTTEIAMTIDKLRARLFQWTMFDYISVKSTFGPYYQRDTNNNWRSSTAFVYFGRDFRHILIGPLEPWLSQVFKITEQEDTCAH